MFRISETRDGKLLPAAGGVLYLQIFANLSDEIRPITIEVDSNEYVSTVKKMVLEEIQEKLIVDVDNYRLIYKGLELQNGSILSDYGVKDWEVLDFYSKIKPKPSSQLPILFDNSFLGEVKDQFWWQPYFGCILNNICIADDTLDDFSPDKYDADRFNHMKTDTSQT